MDTRPGATEDDMKALRNAIMTGTDAPSWLDGMLRQDAVRELERDGHHLYQQGRR